MPRDYKRPARRKGRKTNHTRNGWIWLTGGLVLGAIFGYVGYLLQLGGRPPATMPETAQVERAPTTTPGVSKAVLTPPPAAQPEPEPEPKNRFEFYTLLPEMEMEISDERLEEALAALPKTAESAGSGPFILQVGSFRRRDEADTLKARLALLGIESTIQTVIIRDDDVWYRVRVGPYDSVRELGQTRSRLQRNDIDFMVLRIGT